MENLYDMIVLPEHLTGLYDQLMVISFILFFFMHIKKKKLKIESHPLSLSLFVPFLSDIFCFSEIF